MFQFAEEAISFAEDINAFQGTHDTCSIEISDYFNKMMALFVKITPKNTTAPIILDAATIKDIGTNMGKVPSYIKRLDTMIKTIPTYEQRMKSIKNKINMLKGVN
jgi:hypothetical protein